MSYCRWSSDSFRCDLYCYADVGGGYTTHVAGRRRVGDIIPMPDLHSYNKNDPESWMAEYERHMKSIEESKMEPIDLPHAGVTFHDLDLQSFYARVRLLKDFGYHVPDYVFDRITAEIAEENLNRVRAKAPDAL